MNDDLAKLLLWLLQDIKVLWDQEGFGSDDEMSEPLYARLKAAIKILDEARSAISE